MENIEDIYGEIYLIIDTLMPEDNKYRKMIQIKEERRNQRLKEPYIISVEQYEKVKDVDKQYLNNLGKDHGLEFESCFEQMIAIQKKYPAYKTYISTWHDKNRDMSWLNDGEVILDLGGEVAGAGITFDFDYNVRISCGMYDNDNPYNNKYFYDVDKNFVCHNDEDDAPLSFETILKIADDYIAGKLCTVSTIDKNGYTGADILLPEENVKDLSPEELRHLWNMRYPNGDILNPSDVIQISIFHFNACIDYYYKE